MSDTEFTEEEYNHMYPKDKMSDTLSDKICFCSDILIEEGYGVPILKDKDVREAVQGLIEDIKKYSNTQYQKLKIIECVEKHFGEGLIHSPDVQGRPTQQGVDSLSDNDSPLDNIQNSEDKK